MSRRSCRALLAGTSLFLVLGCGGEEPVEGQLYAPCETDEWCRQPDEEDRYLQCVISPFGGSTEGFCSAPCHSSSDNPEEPILAGGCYPADDDGCWLGCCHINNGWGNGGNGMCMPWGY
ncbi:MAG: hypothetical protein ACOCVR_01125 [Myxococcota bacterium]